MSVFLFLLLSFGSQRFDDGVITGEVFLDKAQTETLGLFNWYSIGVANLHGKTYRTNYDNHLIAMVSEDGDIIKTRDAAGVGPGELRGPRVAMEVTEHIGVLNFANGQLVILTQNLAHVANRKMSFRAKYLTNPPGHHFVVYLLGDKRQIGFVDKKSLRLEKTFFDIRGQRDANGTPLGRTFAFPDGEYIFHFFPGLTRSSPSYRVEAHRFENPSTFNPTQAELVLVAPELDPNILPPIPELPDHIGAIPQVFAYGAYFVVQILLEGANNAVLYGYDFFQRKTGQFLGRHISDVAMLVTPAAEARYLLHNDRVYRMIGFSP